MLLKSVFLRFISVILALLALMLPSIVFGAEETSVAFEIQREATVITTSYTIPHRNTFKGPRIDKDYKHPIVKLAKQGLVKSWRGRRTEVDFGLKDGLYFEIRFH